MSFRIVVATKSREPLPSTLLYQATKWSLVTPLFKTYFRGKVQGKPHIPRHGGAIIVSNHGSYFDPPLIAGGVGRPVAFMAKQELFRVPLLKPIIELYGAYPVNRGSADRSAIKSAIKALNQGWLVGLFLEGTRTPDGRIHKPKLGASLIAAKAQVPIIPVSLWGTERILQGGKLPKPVPLTLRIGEIIEPPASSDRPQLQATTNHCAQVLNQLHDLGR